MHPVDGGPWYCESDLRSAFPEPFNTISELAFLAVIVHWASRLKGRFSEHPFVAAALPVMFVAFCGGVLYHGLRMHRAFLMLDILPLALLLFAAVGYLARRAFCSWVAGALLAPAVFAILILALRHLGFSFAYPMLGGVLGTLALIDLRRRRFGSWGLVAASFGCFAVGAVADALDEPLCGAVPIGLHWLWHVAAAAAVHFLIAYLVAQPTVRMLDR